MINGKKQYTIHKKPFAGDVTTDVTAEVRTLNKARV